MKWLVEYSIVVGDAANRGGSELEVVYVSAC